MSRECQKFTSRKTKFLSLLSGLWLVLSSQVVSKVKGPAWLAFSTCRLRCNRGRCIGFWWVSETTGPAPQHVRLDGLKQSSNESPAPPRNKMAVDKLSRAVTGSTALVKQQQRLPTGDTTPPPPNDIDWSGQQRMRQPSQRQGWRERQAWSLKLQALIRLEGRGGQLMAAATESRWSVETWKASILVGWLCCCW